MVITVQIRICQENKSTLDELKLCETETYDEVLGRILSKCKLERYEENVLQ